MDGTGALELAWQRVLRWPLRLPMQVSRPSTSPAGLPSPGCLISWCRLIHAAYLLRRPDRTIEQTALMLRFGSGTALRLMCRRYLGIRASRVRELGAHHYVLSRLIEDIAEGANPATAAGSRLEHPSAAQEARSLLPQPVDRTPRSLRWPSGVSGQVSTEVTR